MPLSNYSLLPKTERISVEMLLTKLRKKLSIPLKLKTSSDTLENRFITEIELHRPGLALAGYLNLFTYKRVQIFGNTECQYLDNLNKEKQIEAIKRLCEFEIPVVFITHGNKLPSYLLDIFNDATIPVAFTKIESTRFMFSLRDYLEDLFAIQTMVHGAMVDVYGIGVLIAGKSGIGKSEVALDLVERGHRLVADDVVMLTKKNNIIMASATEMNKHFMEIRGLGIIDVMSMFGIRSIRYQKRLEVIIDLALWDDHQDIDRTGLDKHSVNIMDLDIPLIKLPITPGKNITVIAEVIAMNHLLKHYGYEPAKAFQSKIKKAIARKSGNGPKIERAVDYFEGDFE